jgi:anti-anti-sigma factor
MSIKMRAVRVHQIPEQMSSSQVRNFLRDLQECAENERPRFVLDCSRMWSMDSAAIRLLLSSLEEVMKCNGDLRLAGLNPEAEAALRRSGVIRLFEIYPTADIAVQSFHKRPTSLAPLAYESENFEVLAERAA